MSQPASFSTQKAENDDQLSQMCLEKVKECPQRLTLLLQTFQMSRGPARSSAARAQKSSTSRDLPSFKVLSAPGLCECFLLCLCFFMALLSDEGLGEALRLCLCECLRFFSFLCLFLEACAAASSCASMTCKIANRACNQQHRSLGQSLWSSDICKLLAGPSFIALHTDVHSGWSHNMELYGHLKPDGRSLHYSDK